MDETPVSTRRPACDPREARTRTDAGIARVTNAERDFWRRAVEIERARQRCGRPAPFPFQPA
jgi:hypothetical protein